jgi:flagellar motor switch protein FliG
MPVNDSLRNAALVLDRLPAQQSAAIFSRLGERDLTAVLRAINELDDVTNRQVFDALSSLAREAQLSYEQSGKRPSSSFAQQKVELGSERFSEVERLSPFGFLLDLDPEMVSKILNDEHPRNIALVLANLPSDFAADQMRLLEPITRVSVIKRISEMKDHDTDATFELSQALRHRVSKIRDNSESTQRRGLEIVSKLIGFSDAQIQSDLLERLGQGDPDLAAEVSRLVPKFDWLVDASDDDIRVLLQSVDSSCWAPAIKRCSAELQNKILQNMVPKARNLLKREIQNLGNVDDQTVAKAQKQIMKRFLTLQKNG